MSEAARGVPWTLQVAAVLSSALTVVELVLIPWLVSGVPPTNVGRLAAFWVAPETFVWTLMVGIAGATAAFAIVACAHRRWARIVATVTAALGIALLAPSMYGLVVSGWGVAPPVVFGVFFGIPVTLAAVLVGLYLPPSNRYLRRPDPAREPTLT